MKLLLFLFAVMAASKAETNELLKQANQQITAKLFTEVVKQHPKESVVLSAFSVLTPLAQLSLASDGESHDELLKAIGMPNDDTTKTVFSSLTKDVRSVKGVELKVASKVYIPTNFELNDQFLAVTKDVFDSEVQNIDFLKNDDAAKTINTWVEDHTNNRIKDLVEPSSFDSNTRAVLVNAIYFKGSWKEKFNKNHTQNRKFYVSKDQSVDIPFMYKKDHFLYGESEELNAQLLQLPYEGDEASFLVVLPRDVDGLPALEEKLKNPSLLENAVQNMRSVEVVVYLPKFKIETTTNLKDALENMDVTKIFSSEANLNRLLKGQGDLFVSDAKQKAFIEVNEDGAEAAAANAFVAETTSLVISEPLQFNADKPFYFELRHHNKPLFNGVYVQ
ncbi:antichymotrypsin-2 isoform X6 [Amyelois transitella]|uniref:antichymotrypsin-2 isoform X6 n=1 Tax=Amyelois transitella TaxID=680683 RepID=UPI00298FB1E6|nr:antichymotrypsin-2 isoform X6 [Amyelois transitella]